MPRYDLEERAYRFARDVAFFCKNLPKTTQNVEYAKQVIRSSASIAANYIEANESLSRKDFLMRTKISRKEAKETMLFLRLIVDTNSADYIPGGEVLIGEAEELKKIFSAIIQKCE